MICRSLTYCCTLKQVLLMQRGAAPVSPHPLIGRVHRSLEAFQLPLDCSSVVGWQVRNRLTARNRVHIYLGWNPRNRKKWLASFVLPTVVQYRTICDEGETRHPCPAPRTGEDRGKDILAN